MYVGISLPRTCAPLTSAHFTLRSMAVSHVARASDSKNFCRGRQERDLFLRLFQLLQDIFHLGPRLTASKNKKSGKLTSWSFCVVLCPKRELNRRLWTPWNAFLHSLRRFQHTCAFPQRAHFLSWPNLHFARRPLIYFQKNFGNFSALDRCPRKMGGLREKRKFGQEENCGYLENAQTC